MLRVDSGLDRELGSSVISKPSYHSVLLWTTVLFARREISLARTPQQVAKMLALAMMKQ